MTDPPPIACDMTNASDNAEQRLHEYARLFGKAFVGRQRTRSGVRWRLSADPGIEAWAGDLAARENTCCKFMVNAITVVGDEVHWDISTIDDPGARAVLDLFFELPDRAGDGVEELHRQLAAGLPFVTRDEGTG
jgi:hypothetical protein